MIFQSKESKLFVGIGDDELACVTKIEISSERGLTSAGDVDKTSAVHTVTVYRYLPVDVEVGSFYDKSGFELTASDLWSTLIFKGCEWKKIERRASPDGVYETLTFRSKNMSVS